MAPAASPIFNPPTLNGGFGDVSCFNRTFRRRYGAAPSDMREAAQRPK
jgi:transcriptional regulator GlxA family with amidase domain